LIPQRVVFRALTFMISMVVFWFSKEHSQPTRFRGSFACPTVVGHPSGSLTHPGKSILFRSMPAISTILALTIASIWDVVVIPQCCGTGCAYSSDLIASYMVPFRQYRALPQYGLAFPQSCGTSSSLHASRQTSPAILRGRLCDLLMVQGVTPAHKGLAPSRLIYYLSIVKRCPCWAHTLYHVLHH
jgi:hypothetical protein